MATLLEPHGLTTGQFSILHHITRPAIGGGSRVSEIAAAVEVEQPAVTKALAKFQNLGLVEIVSHKSDKRAKVVSATPAAGALLGRIYQDIGPDLQKVFGSIDEAELEAFAKTLKQLGQWLDANRLG
ncbi:DNA-binding transcriptional regulator, MarR family [Octadecabacter temperatus]|uniref:Transcriptional regulator SlyA n=1 Tax=Octadecabacter temperatus TaxID=1458307 RepID=A0A0K0Y3L6_9RHOB|nr:MarR family transcriptional regulator [Octadecabacter temperatus]AKS45534.1 Transcriptional regulator SlyA [Octadecabacter temperatus]SIN95095.1 DNA-binding transcriptional regulator, MarR family [Octadecabacter temperatus]